MDWLHKIPWSLLIVACLTIGLAPYRPPHVWEKLVMLSRGELVRPLDWFDFLMHATPWVLLVLKGALRR
jgi:hypothetical protein